MEQHTLVDKGLLLSNLLISREKFTSFLLQGENNSQTILWYREKMNYFINKLIGFFRDNVLRST